MSRFQEDVVDQRTRAHKGPWNSVVLLIGVAAGLYLAGLLVALMGEAIGQESDRATAETSHEEEDLVSILRLDKPFQSLEMTDTQKRVHNLDKLSAEGGVVLAFLNTHCPVSRRYSSVLNELAKTYGPRGISVVGVVCDVGDPNDVEGYIREYQVGFPVMYDPQHRVARHLRASVTPQVFLLDRQLVLRYFGAIDDQYLDRTTRLDNVRSRYLANALEELLGGKPITIKHSHAIGCPLVSDKPEPKLTGTVTFHRDVEPILQKHCQTCHHPQDVAPFSLLRYEDALNWAEDIREYTAKRLMPPWPVTGGVPFQNDTSLSDEEIETIRLWVEEGCPRGAAADAPPPKRFVSRESWDDEQPPDLVLQLPEAFHLAANGDDHYRTFAFPLNNTAEVFIRKLQFIPGNKKIVHHCLVFFDGTGMVLDAQNRLGNPRPKGTGDEDYGPGYASGMGLGFIPKMGQFQKNRDNPGGGLGGWVPGSGPFDDPAGSSHLVPPEAAVFMQVHYHRTGKPETDSGSRVGIWFERKQPEFYVQSLVADTTFRMIPKGVARFKATGTRVIPVDSELWLLSPHMHSLGREFRVWHQPHDSKERKLLLELKNWDFNWQWRYRLKEHYPLQAGDKIHVEAIFDNSAGNPNNPNQPPRTVFLGEGSTDEMAFAVVTVVRRTKPEPGTDFISYFEKLLEAQGIKKLLGAP